MAVRIRKKGGNWYVFVNYAGRRKAKCIGANKAAAEQVKRVIEAKLALGDLGFLQDVQADEEKKTTFQQYANDWVETYAKLHCKESTVASHRQLLRLYLLPRFGSLPLEQITRESVRDFLAELASRRKTERKKRSKRRGSSAAAADQTTRAKLPDPSAAKLSRNTLRLALCTLRVILNHAVDDSVIGRNPAARLGKFTKTEKPKAQAQALTRTEVDAFLNAALEICADYYPLFLTAVRAGLRRGELVALRWGDIQCGESEHDSNRFIFVQHNYVRRQFTTTKSKKARRVDLSRQLRQVLLQLRDERLVKAYAGGRASVTEDLVFPSEAGTVLDPDNLVHYYFLPTLEKAGLRKIRFHDLRHTFGSLLIQDGASLTYVKEQMGHSSIQVTVDVYGHLVPGADIAWVDRLDGKTGRQQSATPAQPDANQASEEGEVLSPEVVDALRVKDGERGRNRTYNLLIKSQLLCQLSYAPCWVGLGSGAPGGDIRPGRTSSCNAARSSAAFFRRLSVYQEHRASCGFAARDQKKTSGKPRAFNREAPRGRQENTSKEKRLSAEVAKE
jgi:integrase